MREIMVTKQLSIIQLSIITNKIKYSPDGELGLNINRPPTHTLVKTAERLNFRKIDIGPA